ncbi:MAG: glucose 1-dehydrogenase [Saprospiraceae bacterium]|nr:glucose 1-dehydrogenase [Saprospiraceae bacterium]
MPNIDKFNLQNKVAIITGSSKGIGKAIAIGLAEQGAHVVISSRKQDAVDLVSKEINDSGLSSIGIACHVGEEDQLKNLVQKTKEAFGGVDILINNAGINPVFAPVSQADAAIFDKIININTKACMLLSNLCYPSMVERGGGSIINIASVEGLKPSAGLGVYSISKAALNMLTKVQAKEWGPNNIRSNSICPGLIKTKLSAALWQDEKTLSKIERHLPSQRMALPDEMVGLALFLASDSSSYCTGGIYTADGGYMIA